MTPSTNNVWSLPWVSVWVLSRWSPCVYCMPSYFFRRTLGYTYWTYANRKLLWSASFSIFLNNRNNQRRRSDRKPKKSPSERRLRKLDAESPTCTLQEWWSKSKVPPVPSAAEGDGQFIWYGILSTSLYCYMGGNELTNLIVPSASNPSWAPKKSEISNVYMSFTKNVWINGICKTSSIVRFAIARIISSTFSLQMSLCGWYNVFLPPRPSGSVWFGLVCSWILGVYSCWSSWSCLAHVVASAACFTHWWRWRLVMIDWYPSDTPSHAMQFDLRAPLNWIPVTILLAT